MLLLELKKIVQINILFIVVAIAFNAIFALSLSGQVSVLDINRLVPKNGLLQTDNYFCFKDSRGRVWISSLSGLYVFDGTNVNRLDEKLHGQIINGSILEDTQGNIWFSTISEIYRYEPIEDELFKMELPDSASSDVQVITLDGLGDIWYARGGVIKTYNIENKSVKIRTEINDGSQRYEVHKSEDGAVNKMVTYSLNGVYQGFYVYNFQDAQSGFTVEYHNQSHIIGNIRDCYFEDADNLIISSTFGLIFYRLKDRTTQLLRPDDEVKIWHFNTVSALTNAEIIMGTYAGDIYVYDTENKKWSQYKLISGSGNVNNPCQSIFVDENYGAWITLPGVGLGFFNWADLILNHKEYEISTRFLNSGIAANGFLLTDTTVIISSENHGLIRTNGIGEVVSHLHADNSELLWNITDGIKRDNEDNIWLLGGNRTRVIDEEGKLLKNFGTESLQLKGLFINSKNQNILYSSRTNGLYRVDYLSEEIIIDPVYEADSNKLFTYMAKLNSGQVFGSYNLNHVGLFGAVDFDDIGPQIRLEGFVYSHYELNDTIIWLGTGDGIL